MISLPGLTISTGRPEVAGRILGTFARFVDQAMGSRWIRPMASFVPESRACVQLTWMNAKIGEWVVTPRTGKAVEINALCAMREFARRLGRPAEEWEALTAQVRAGFARFWSERSGYCYDVIDGPDGNDDALRPNQILAVSLPPRARCPRSNNATWWRPAPDTC